MIYVVDILLHLAYYAFSIDFRFSTIQANNIRYWLAWDWDGYPTATEVASPFKLIAW